VKNSAGSGANFYFILDICTVAYVDAYQLKMSSQLQVFGPVLCRNVFGSISVSCIKFCHLFLHHLCQAIFGTYVEVLYLGRVIILPKFLAVCKKTQQIAEINKQKLIIKNIMKMHTSDSIAKVKKTFQSLDDLFSFLTLTLYIQQ
jgi:hypothetical protein